METTRETQTRTRTLPWLEPAAAIWSALVAGVGGWWLAEPAAYPDAFTDARSEASLVALLDHTTLSWLLVGLGTVGVVGALAGLRPSAPAGRRLGPVTAVAAVYAVVFGLIAPDVSLLVAMGYLSAILGPPVLLTVLAASAVRHPRARLVLAGALAVGTVFALAFGVRLESFAEFGRGLMDGLGRSGPATLFAVTMFTGGLLWVAVLLRGLARADGGSAGARRTLRSPAPPVRGWVRWVTIAAALCPLPYVLLRMTWLTPWPVLVSRAELEASPALRIFGLSLGLAAVGGSVLIIGLISTWGQVYPRWVPVVGGRVVSPTWPTATAVLVGVAITIAGRSMVQMVIAGTGDDGLGLEGLLLLPFPVWGPLLVAAGVGYYLRRTTAVSGVAWEAERQGSAPRR